MNKLDEIALRVVVETCNSLYGSMDDLIELTVEDKRFYSAFTRALLADPELLAELIKGEPVAYQRKWDADGEKPAKEKNENGRLAWPFRFKLLPVSKAKCLPDDIPLFTRPAPANTAEIEQRVAEACANMAVSWGNSREDDCGGHALRNYSRAVEAEEWREFL